VSRFRFWTEAGAYQTSGSRPDRTRAGSVGHWAAGFRIALAERQQWPWLHSSQPGLGTQHAIVDARAASVARALWPIVA